MNKRKLSFYSGIVVLIICSVFILFYCISRDNVQPPQISSGLRVGEVKEDKVTVVWVVENLSDRTITFDENCFIQIILNNKKIPYYCEAIALQPGEEKRLTIKLTNLREGMSNQIECTTVCNEGTKTTYKCTITP